VSIEQPAQGSPGKDIGGDDNLPATSTLHFAFKLVAEQVGG
jgi:hypothetical protein